MGTWRGGLFDTGHSHNRRADAPQWYGKRISSLEDAWPDLIVDDDNEIRASSAHGSLALTEFRGELVASLLYDTEPVMDHFKKVDDWQPLGVMDRRIDREAGSFLVLLARAGGKRRRIPSRQLGPLAGLMPGLATIGGPGGGPGIGVVQRCTVDLGDRLVMRGRTDQLRVAAPFVQHMGQHIDPIVEFLHRPRLSGLRG